VIETPNPSPAEQPEPARRRARRRRRKRRPDAASLPPATSSGLIPPVIKVEIQNIDQLGRAEPERRGDDVGLEIAQRELEEREARLAAAEASLVERRREVEELEERIGPEAVFVESRELLERRERRVREQEERFRERSRELDQRENDFEARKAVVEADLELREEEVERREDLVVIREERLADRQRELGVYVSQIQGTIESHLAAG